MSDQAQNSVEDVIPSEGTLPKPTPDEAREALADRLEARFDAPRLTPALVLLLAVIHVAVGVFRASRGATTLGWALAGPRGARLLARMGGMKTSRLDKGELWRLVSAVFLHTDLIHLSLNLVGLFLVGRLIEAIFGRVRLFFIFLASGVLGAACSWLVVRTPLSVGASGGIYGLLGAALVFVLRHGDELPDDVRTHLRKQLLLAIALNLPIGFVLPVIDQAAHIGGLVGGAVLGAVMGDGVTETARGHRLATAGMALVSLLWVAAAVFGLLGSA
jgi:rhomboid protease GluP